MCTYVARFLQDTTWETFSLAVLEGKVARLVLVQVSHSVTVRYPYPSKTNSPVLIPIQSRVPKHYREAGGYRVPSS